MARIVVALGGNALGCNPVQQIEKVTEAAHCLVDLVVEGHELVLCHGNGPQVGMINLAFDKASQSVGSVPSMPLAECTAMSQGYIGYHLQQAIARELRHRGSDRNCVTVVTEVLVDSEDPAFLNPTKPIGSFVDRQTAERLMTENPGSVYRDDAGRGWREYVASPTPQAIVERDAIKSLVNTGFVVVACGGGGIPVITEGNGTRGVAAVIDKDRSAARLAEEVGASLLVILTAVDKVAVRWGSPDQEELSDVDVETLTGYLEEGHFAEGSMKPKVEAALQFVTGGSGREAIIGSLEQAGAAIAGSSGTRIRR